MAINDTLEQKAVDTINGRNDSVELVPGGKKVNNNFVPVTPKSAALTPLPSPVLTPPNQVSAPALSTPTPIVEPTPTANSYAEFQNFIKSVAPENTELTTSRSNILTAIRDRMSAIGQKGNRQNEIENELGVSDMQTKLMDYNTQIANLKNSFDMAIVNEEGVARPQEFITGRQDFLQKKRTAQVDALTSVVEAMQGNLEIAQDMAKDAVDREFADEEADLEALWVEYNANKEDLERDDKKKADTLAQNIAERARVLTDKKEEREGVISLAQEAAINGAPQGLVSRITQASSIEEAMSMAGGYIGLLERQAKLQSISASRTNQLLALAEAGDPDSIAALGFDPRSVEEEVDPVTRRQLEAEVDGTSELLDLASQYRNLIEANGYTNTIAGDPRVLGQIDSLRAQLTAAYKKAETLGTLDAGVLNLMGQLLGESPTSGLDFTKNLTGRPAAKLVSSLDSFIDTAEKSKARASLRLGIQPAAFEVIADDDLSEIDSILGPQGAGSTTFSPANFY